MPQLRTLALVMVAAQVSALTCLAQAPYSGPYTPGTQTYGGTQPYGGGFQPSPAGQPYGGAQTSSAAPMYGPTDAGVGNIASQGSGPVSYSGDYSAVGGPVSPGAGGYDQLYPYDAPQPWVHGYWQEIPAYGGWFHFRPYNYKHALSQSQVAAGWGMSPVMPYSHELFRKYPPNSNTQQARTERSSQQQVARQQTSQERKPSFDDQVYRAELARLRAQRDFDRLHGRTEGSSQSEHAQVQSLPAPQPSETLANVPVSLNTTARPTVTPANHVQQRQLSLPELQERLRQQERELKELQEAIRRETERR